MFDAKKLKYWHQKNKNFQEAYNQRNKMKKLVFLPPMTIKENLEFSNTFVPNISFAQLLGIKPLAAIFIRKFRCVERFRLQIIVNFNEQKIE